MRVGHVSHQLRVTEPTIGDHQWPRQVEAPSAQGPQSLIEHDLSPSQFGAAPPPRPFGVGPAHRKVGSARHVPLVLAEHAREVGAVELFDDALSRLYEWKPRREHAL